MGRRHHSYSVPAAAHHRARQLRRSVDVDVAFVWRDQTGFWARATSESAVVNLVQGVYAVDAPLAQWFFRRRVFTTSAANDADAQLCKVAAGKVSFGCGVDDVDDDALLHGIEWTEVTAAAAHSRAHASVPQMPLPDFVDDATFWHLCPAPKDDVTDPTQPRPVRAVLLDDDGQALLWADNDNGRDKSRHAELVLAQQARRQGLSLVDKRVWVSLQPCRMCAARLLADGVREVVYVHADPGRLATGTALERAGLLRQMVVPDGEVC